MRQEEEWEQVIQGLWGPGRAQVSAGVGGVRVCESRAVRQGEAPSSSHRSSGEVGARDPSTRHCSIAAGHRWGEQSTLPCLQGVAERLNSLQGIIIIKAGKGGLGSGQVTFGSDRET